ncbi:MAG: hypothetical protein ACKO9V_04745, partial [Candidatus Kapaibacterium sp.]
MRSPSENRKEIVIRVPVFRIPWDSNTFRGFLLGLVLLLLFVSMSPFIRIAAPALPSADTTSIPITILTQLRFGEGDQAGRSHGNLQREGAAAQAPTKAPRYADASSPAKGEKSSNAKPASTQDLQVNVQPVRRDPETARQSGSGSATETTTSTKNAIADNASTPVSGDRTNNENGTGRGWSGSGSGAGLGYNIEWGGGG